MSHDMPLRAESQRSCPMCCQALPDAAQKCPQCGERLDHASRATPVTRTRWRIIPTSLLGVFGGFMALGGLLVVVLSFVAPNRELISHERFVMSLMAFALMFV